MKITMAHGSGGRATDELIQDLFAKEFRNEILAQMEDSAVVNGSSRIAVTTDSFVVTPVEYPGGDIGRLSVCGTVNDLLMRGAVPQYLTCGFILQEGADTHQLSRIVKSMSETAREAGVTVVAGDTKVVEGNGGIMINTSGIGFVQEGVHISAKNSCAGDVIIVSGTLGEHHAAILSSRLSVQNCIASDNAPLKEMVFNLLDAGISIHTMRDVTRGGLATILKELAVTAKVEIEIEESALPVDDTVQQFCRLLGLDPLYMGNEGKMVVVVPQAEAASALEIIRHSAYGQKAQCIGKVLAADKEHYGRLILNTEIGGRRMLDVLQGEGLPRIC